jgi:glycine/D-amino acid oxidase-like deaminating enzyme
VITIVGGGVAGASLAGALARRGRRDVAVFDLLPAGSGSTARALGGFRTQHGSRLNIALSLASRPWFEARAARVGFQPHGYLYLAEDEAVAAELESRARLQRECGLPITHPDPGGLVPFLDASQYVAANFCALDGVYLPPLVHGALVEEAESAGARFHWGEAAPAAALEGSEAIVIAAGTWSPAVARAVGVELEVTPLERVVWEVGPFEWLRGLRVPMTLEAGSGYHFRERRGSLLLMGPGDQGDWEHFRRWLSRRVPAAAEPRPAGSWTGSYEITFDHHPLVGETSRPGVWACCGFSGHGVMHSPAIGEALAAMMLGETPVVDVTPLSPLRAEPLRDLTQL